MKKTISILLAFTLLAAVFSGCSRTDNENTSAVSEAASASSTEAAGNTASVAADDPDTTDATTLDASADGISSEVSDGNSEASSKSASEPVAVNIIALKGPTAMGMVKFMDDVDAGIVTDNEYSFQIAAAIDEVTPQIAQGKVDIAAVPANVGSVLYNNTSGKIQVLAINTLGVLYIVESGEDVQSVEDLRGKTIYASGKGATPEAALNYILAGNGIDPTADVTIEWKSEHAECLAALLADEDAIAMLPQPFVTTALTKSDKLSIALDLTEEWDALQGGTAVSSALITGTVVVRKDFADEHPEAVAAFLNHYKDSVDYVNANIDEAAELVGKYDIVPAEVAKKAIPACNIVLIDGQELQEKLSGYLGVLLEQNPQMVGGALPEDDFYYKR